MNVLSMLAGDIIGTLGNHFASNLMQQISPLANSGFMNILQSKETSSLKISDLNLSNDELQDVLELRKLAVDNGLDSIEIEIHGQRYDMKTEDLSIVPVVERPVGQL
ncbi:MAG: hypothetical protein LW817_03355 [Candidatus Caenarcaniphilales bacterium]|jgi:hypothetical protein|nr:hypothetical protein [Candidatus Caenarcaniphilales bacterium]